ncbi:hypothetical protein ACMX2H_16035 [Arthrobacter sulfonylureivorans]|uniref:hypothetical protein n=1 Tax=Arthrobacter sulfonylureivorans TaxID=2486855 RepID=UPI0039E54CCD
MKQIPANFAAALKRHEFTETPTPQGTEYTKRTRNGSTLKVLSAGSWGTAVTVVPKEGRTQQLNYWDTTVEPLNDEGLDALITTLIFFT